MRYNSKIVCFLANGNSVLVKDETDLKLLKQIFNSVGLDEIFENETFESILNLIKSNCERKHEDYKLEDTFLVEYNNNKGVCLGWHSTEESKDWFGINPFSVMELVDETLPF